MTQSLGSLVLGFIRDRFVIPTRFFRGFLDLTRNTFVFAINAFRTALDTCSSYNQGFIGTIFDFYTTVMSFRMAGEINRVVL